MRGVAIVPDMSKNKTREIAMVAVVAIVAVAVARRFLPRLPVVGPVVGSAL